MPYNLHMLNLTQASLTLTLLLSLLSSFGCSSKRSEIDEFRRFIESTRAATEASAEPYFNRPRALWAKRKYEIKDLTYDVRKTDSLVNPIVGLASFTLLTSQTALVSTKEEAQRSTEVDIASQNAFRVSLNFTYDGGVWTLKRGQYSIAGLPAEGLAITPGKIQAEPDAIPFAPLRLWLKSM